MNKKRQLEIELKIAMYMSMYQPKRELYWKQIAKDIRRKIKNVAK